MAKINWNKIVTAQNWQRLAMQLTESARTAASQNDAKAMQAAGRDLRDFLVKQTNACPTEVADAVYGAGTALNRLIALDVAGSIASRTVQLNAYMDDIKQAGERIEEQAKAIGLKSIRNAVERGHELIGELKKLRQSIKADMDAPEVTAQINEIAASLQELFKGLENAIDHEET